MSRKAQGLVQIDLVMTGRDMDKGPHIGVGRTAEVYAWGDHQILKLYRADMPRELVHHQARIGQTSRRREYTPRPSAKQSK